MEEIKQRVYFIDGVPSNKSGEWPGIKPSHWGTSSIKILAQSHLTNVFEGVKEKDSGRKHFKEPRSNEYEFKSSIKNFSPKPLSEEIVKIKKREEYVFPEQKFYFPKRVFEERRGIERYPEPLCHIPTGKFNRNSLDEWGVDEKMGNKKRVYTLEQMRNSLNYSSLGDKSYRNVDYLPGFFQAGGLIVGSTNTINYNKSTSLKNNNFYSSLDLNIKTLDPNKLWKNKMFNEEKENDVNYVKGVSSWDKEVLSEFVPKIDKTKEIVNKNNTKTKAPQKKK